jgi:DNA-binding NarL/FixJ family response regulator
MAGTVRRPISSALIVSRSLGLCRLGKWLLRRLRVRSVHYTGEEGKRLNRVINGIYPELILFDASFFEEVTARRIGYLLRDVPGLNIAVFSMGFISPKRATQFLRYGAKSYFDMSGSGSFLKGLKTVLRGGIYVTPAVREAIDNLPDTMLDLRLDIEGRVEDVKQLIFKAKSVKESANILNVSVKTVENTRTKLFACYGVETVLEFFRCCYLLGEIDKSEEVFYHEGA